MVTYLVWMCFILLFVKRVTVRDRLVGLAHGSYVSADVLIMQIIPSRDGYCYALLHLKSLLFFL